MSLNRPALPRALLAALVAGALSALSCIDAPTGPRPLAIVTATPEALSLRPFDSLSLTARVTSIDGAELEGRALAWRSLDTTVVTVNPLGLVAGQPYTGPSRRTTAVLVSSADATTDTVPVEVLPLEVARVLATPDAVTIAPRDSTQLNLRLESGAGLELSDRVVAWIVDDTSVVRVSPSGRAVARAYTGPLARHTWVIGFSEGRSDSVRVTVPPLDVASISVAPSTVELVPGQLDTLSALVRSADGETLTDIPLQWSSSDTTVVRVNAAGVVTAVFYVGFETRAAQVIVGHGSVADTATIEVRPLAVSAVEISPDSAVLLPGAEFQLSAALTDAAGLFLTDRPVAWSSTDTTIARVDATGRVTARAYGGTATGVAHVIASSGGAADTVRVVVPPHEVFSVAVTPAQLSVQPLAEIVLVARLEALDGTVLSNRPIAWSSLDTAVATVDTDGTVQARPFAGSVVRSTAIVVVSGIAADTVPVEVLPLAVDRVLVAPSTLTLAARESAPLSLTVLSASDIALTGHPAVWVSGDTAALHVSETGVVTARPYFGPLERTVSVVVFVAGVADTASITIQPLAAAAVQLSADSITLVPGAVDTLSALVRSASSDTLVDFPLLWRSTDTTVARVNVEGIVTAAFYVGAAARTASIIVGTGALADTTRVGVTPLPVGAVIIADNAGTVNPGGALQLDATVRDAEGLFLAERTITWSSSDTTIARVDATGLVTALVYGGTATRQVQIIASSESVADSVTLTLPPLAAAWLTASPEAISLAPLQSATITALVQSLDLVELTGRPVTFTSLNDTVATVTAAGEVTATAYTGPSVRNTAIVVASAAATDTVPLSVTPLSVARVIATPTTLALSPGDSATLNVSLEAADATVLTNRERLWLSSDTTVVTVDSGGLVIARPYVGALERTANIVVYGEGLADTVVVTVLPLPAASIVLAPDSASLFPGDQTTLSASVRTASDLVLTGTPLTWTSIDTTVAIVNAEGIVTAVFYVGPDERTTAVIAATGTLADTALIRVRALLVDSVAIFPDTQTLQIEQTAQLAAVLRDSAGLFLTGRPITWSSSDSARATVSETGLVTALMSGTVTITASSGGASSQATITIVPVVTSVRVTPELSTIWIGRSQPFTVALRDTNGVAPAGRRVTWSSSDSTRATVDSLGVVTALATGTVTIRAISEGRSDSASVDIFPEPTAAITITFDDSWRGVLELAYPVMQELRLRANVGWITSVNWSGVMNPTELRVLQDAGWSIVSHSMTHPFLTQIPLDSARVELAGSRARIDSLGFDPRVFIAPYLNHNDDVLIESAAAGYTYTRCCAEDVWSTDTLVSWPIQPAARHRLAGVDVTNYDGQISSFNFRFADGRARLRQLLLDVVAEGKFIDVFFHDVLPEDVPDLRLTMEILAEFRPYLITYAMLP